MLLFLCSLFAHGTHADEALAKSATLPSLEQSTELQTQTALPVEAELPARSADPAHQPTTIHDASSLEISAILNSASPADLWERVRNGFALKEMNNQFVRDHEAWYANRPEYLKRTADRSKRYMFHIVEAVENRGMPTEIALLPFIESAYNPKALSPARASGIWQFIPSTGKHYGLEQNWWYDGRRDVLAATDAALDYLQKLHDQFGSWELALAAYNCGEGCVERAIARNQAKGEPTDYQSLGLPAETRQYVPKLIAVRNIVSNPAAYNLSLASIPNKPYFTTVSLNQHIDIKLVAKLAEIPLDEFVALNPAYNRPVVSATSPRTLLLPVDKLDEFSANLENNSRPLVSWQSYNAKRGESLNAIARRFGTSISWLKSNNHILIKRNKLATNQLLLVPIRGGKADITTQAVTVSESSSDSEATSSNNTVYVVKKGDTLLSIAKRVRMNPRQLKSLNGLKSNRLAVGRKLVVATEYIAAKNKTTRVVRTAKPSASKRIYTVRRGDTLSSIARRFKVASNDIQRWNNLSGRRALMPGTKVRVLAGVE